jgi:hypothetical protein
MSSRTVRPSRCVYVLGAARPADVASIAGAIPPSIRRSITRDAALFGVVSGSPPAPGCWLRRQAERRLRSSAEPSMCSKRPASERGRRDARSGRSGAPRSAPLPPVRLFTVLAPVRQRVRGLLPLASARPAELPKFGGGPLVVVNQVVHVELIDLAGVELGEPGAHVFEKGSQLALVIGGDQLPRGTTIGLVP